MKLEFEWLPAVFTYGERQEAGLILTHGSLSFSLEHYAASVRLHSSCCHRQLRELSRNGYWACPGCGYATPYHQDVTVGTELGRSNPTELLAEWLSYDLDPLQAVLDASCLIDILTAAQAIVYEDWLNEAAEPWLRFMRDVEDDVAAMDELGENYATPLDAALEGYLSSVGGKLALPRPYGHFESPWK